MRCLTRAALVALALLPGVPAAAQQALPSDIASYIRKEYDENTRYLDGSIDLNGDGKPEMLVHVVGPMACGTGGCPTLVFTPTDKGYRLVSRISITNAPIKASAASTAGWRNLVVHVSGGGAKPHDAELLSDGKGYPTNPSVPGARVRAAGAGGDVVIKDFKSFDETKTLPKAGAAPVAGATAAAAVAGAGPSFDCAKATAPVEKLVCSDAALATLDRDLAAAYAKYGKAEVTNADKDRQRTAQRTWIARRNACATENNTRDCVDTAYRQRLTELRIMSGDLMVPAPVAYRCKAAQDLPTTAVFYNETEPKSAVVTRGDQQAIAFIVPSGSGAHYVGNGVDFWEHGGEAAIKFGSGPTLTCTVVK